MAMTHNSKRIRLLTGCAMATALAGHAHAQSYPDRALQGSSTTTLGNVTINRSPTIDHIIVNSPTAIINWNPETGYGQLPPGPINFLPSGRTASFETGYGGSAFTVLNRVLPSDQTRPIVFNGSVTSASNGSVWFYSPGGIIAGATATFNVGNLVLTSSDIDTTGGLFGSNGEIRFRGTPGSLSTVDIKAGAQINLAQNNSYLLVVSPIVNMSGSATVNGSVGYVAAESVDVRVNTGLFDISFVAGTTTDESSGASALTHSATANTKAAPDAQHAIYFAEMPKNTVISALLSGSIGYIPAGSAFVENGTVVLSGGYDVHSPAGNGTYFAAAPNTAIGTYLDLSAGAYFGSSVVGLSNDTISHAQNGGNLTFAGSASLTAGSYAYLGFANNDKITVGGDLTLRTYLADGEAAISGAGAVNRSPSLTVGGNTLVDASVFGTPNFSPNGLGGAAHGGSARIFSQGTSTITLNGSATVIAHGTGGDGDQGGTGTGGRASLNVGAVTAGGRITIGGNLTLDASGTGGRGTTRGGTGDGGMAIFDAANTGANGGLHATNVSLYAEGIAGETGYGGDIVGGIGTGGSVQFHTNTGTIQTSSLFFSAGATGGQGHGTGNGGAATAGTIDATFQNTILALDSFFTGASAGAGSVYNQVSGQGGNGGAAKGGGINIVLDNATLTVANTLQSYAVGEGGYAASGDGGAGQGGTVALGLGNASTLNADLFLHAQAEGGSTNFNYDADQDRIADMFGHGGAATGGTVTLGVSDSNLNAPTSVDLGVNATGGQGPVGGNATAGDILLNLTSGTIASSQSGVFKATANAIGGTTGLRDYQSRVDAARSGDATGGTIMLNMGGANSGATLAFDRVVLSAASLVDGESGGDLGAQGDAHGGMITALLFNSTVAAGESLSLDVSAVGGVGTSNFSSDATAGGNAIGGTASFSTSNSLVTSNAINIVATGTGGEGNGNRLGEYGDILATRGGSGTGGTAIINAFGSNFAGTITLDASGIGGVGGAGDQADGAAGGAAQGGTANAMFGLAQLNGPLFVYGTAVGGAGGASTACNFICTGTPPFGAGDGGNAVAGDATANLFTSNSTLNTIIVSSAATGGAGGEVDADNFGDAETGKRGGNGGNAMGANASLTLSGAGNFYGDLTVSSFSEGGVGGAGPTGGTGGNAISGNSVLGADSGSIAPSTVTVDASAAGGNGGNSGLFGGSAGGNALAGIIDIQVFGPQGALILPSDGATFNASAQGGTGGLSLAQGGNGGAGGSAGAGQVDFIVSEGLLDGTNSPATTVNLTAVGGTGGTGANGGTPGSDGGNGGVGGDATGGLLSFSASLGGMIDLPQFTLDIQVFGGDGGDGGIGANGQTGDAGAVGEGFGDDGGIGGTGGIGGNGGHGAMGGSATGGRFSAYGLSGGSITFGDLNVDLTAFAGRSGNGGSGGAGGMGGTGGTGGMGYDDGDGTVIDPGTGGMGGQGGQGGNGGIGGNGANAFGGEFDLDANGGTITTGNLSAYATAAARGGGQFGFGGSGGERGYGGEGGYGGQGNTGAPGFFGDPGNLGGYGSDGQTQGGLISILARADEVGGGTLTTGFTTLDTTGTVNGNEYRYEDGPGEIRIGASGIDSSLTFSGLLATAGQLESQGLGGLIQITGADTTLNFGDTNLLSSGSIDIALDGAAAILGGGGFTAQANNGIDISHSALADDGDTLSAGNITLTASDYIDATTARLASSNMVAVDAVTLTSTAGYVTVGSIGNAPTGTPGSITVNAAGAVILTHAETSGNLLVNGDSFATGLNSIIAGGDVDITVAGLADLGNTTAGGHANVDAGSISFVSLTSGDYTQLIAHNGGIMGTTLNSGAATTLDGATGIAVGTLVSTGAVSLDAAGGAVQIFTQLDAPSVTASGQSIDFVSNKAIVAPTLIATAGGITVNAGSFSGTSATATGAVGITAPGGITLSTLNAGAASTLNAANGAVLVSSNIAAPALNAVGRSVTLRATGSLTGLSGQATAGAFDAQAGGSISGGAISASTNANLVAPAGITLTGLTTGGNATLSAANGNINVTGIASNGLTATARDIFLRGPGPLTATNLTSSVGGIDVQTMGNLAVNAANAKSALTLASSGGSLGFTTLTAGSDAMLSAATTINGGTLNSSTATIGGLNGVTLTGLSVSGTAALLATNGLINATNVTAANVTATARGITLTSPTLLSASQLTATAGNIDVRGTQLALGTATATGTLDARASQGGIAFTSAQAGGNATLIAATTITGGTLTSGGNATLTAPNGILLTGLNAGGSAQLTATSGLVDVSGLVGSNVSVTANAIRLAGAGAFSGNSLNATGGLLNLNFGGAVTLGSASAATTLDITSGAALSFTNLFSTGNLTLIAASVSGGGIYGNSAVAVTAPGGITIGNLNSGSTALLTATNGNIDVAETGYGSIGATGRDIKIVSSGNLNGTALTATAGNLTLRGASMTVANGSASGLIDARTTAGPLDFGTLSSGGNATLVSATTATGNTLSGAAISVTAPGGIDIANLRATGAAALSASNGSVRISNDIAAAGLTASGTSLFLRSLGSFDAASLTSTSGTIDIGTAGALTFTTLNSAGATTINAGTTVTGTTLISGGTTNVTAPGGITLGTLQSTGTTTLTAPGAAVRVNTEVTTSNLIVDAGSIFLRTPGTLNLGQIRASTGDADIASTGNLTITSATAAGALTLASGAGNVSVGSIGGGQLSPTTASLTAVGSITLGDATASSAINLSAGTIANLNGTMTAPTIGIRSADIAIANTARIGSIPGTTQLTFTSTAGTTTIGGSSTGSGYRLSEAELQRAFANNITVTTVPTGQSSTAIDPNATPALTLDTLTLAVAGQGQQAAGNIGNGGALRFQTAGTMRVTGAVKLTGATANNTLELTGGPAIQIRPGGSASLVNGTDVAGTLILTAADIIASDATTLGALATAADAKAQGTLLGANPGATDDTGYFAANTVNVSIGHGLFVQNSGVSQTAGAQTFDDRRGFTVGSGGLNIVSNAGTPVTVAINGRQVSTTATGGFITGAALVPLVKVGTANATTTLVTGSSINGCAIGSTAACSFVIPGFDQGSVIEPGSIARDTIEASDLLDDLETASNAIKATDVLIELPGFSALVGQPLIEDPVTGSGNDDLLADKDGKQCDPSVETCTKE